MADNTIFGLRFGSNEAIQPSLMELKDFLISPKKEGKKERHEDDLAEYLQQLKRVEDFVHGQSGVMTRLDFSEKMFYGVLSHSQFFKSTLKLAVEHYKYHYHRLVLIDFKKPMAFIKSAEEETSKLNPKKKDDQAKIARFQGMIDQRTRDMETLKNSWSELGKELENIAIYMKENLVKIQALCESSIVILVDLQIGRKKESQLIEDIKTHFREQIRDYLKVGPVTKHYVETLKEDVAKLSKQISLQLLEDIYFLTRVYEAVHDHVKKTAGRLDALIQRIKQAQHKGLDQDRDLLGQVEQALVSLVSEYQFDVEGPKEVRDEAEHEKILLEKRREMLDHLFALLKKGPTPKTGG